VKSIFKVIYSFTTTVPKIEGFKFTYAEFSKRTLTTIQILRPLCNVQVFVLSRAVNTNKKFKEIRLKSQTNVSVDAWMTLMIETQAIDCTLRIGGITIAPRSVSTEIVLDWLQLSYEDVPVICAAVNIGMAIQKLDLSSEQ
jgi:hypothetical protein